MEHFAGLDISVEERASALWIRQARSFVKSRLQAHRKLYCRY